jgi:transposase
VIRVRLDETQVVDLKKLRKKAGIEAERALMVLLSNEGLSAEVISKRLSRHPHIVRTWLKRYQKNGIVGLSDKKRSGRKPELRQLLDKNLNRILEGTPRDCGFEQSGWSVGILQQLFAKELSKNVSDSSLRRALKSNGWTYKRFAKKVPEKAPSKEKKQERIDEINQLMVKDCVDEVVFLDESHFSNQPYVQRGWFRKGEKKKSLRPTKEKA